MKITRLTAESFRRFEHAGFEPHPHLTVLHGANASGKTSLLEAAYFGARATSFRARRLDEVVLEKQQAASVSLWIAHDPKNPATQWTTAIQNGEVTIRRLTEASNRRELAQAIPVVLVDRQLHRVFEEGPVYRRRYLDWGLFYVEPSFFTLWRRHERALRQRNQALRQRAPKAEVEVWNPEFIATANALHQLRLAHVKVLEQSARRWVAELLQNEHFSFALSSGWNEQLGLEGALAEGYEGDRKMGFTHAGPHRAELRVRFEQREARAFVSRGQQKLLAVAMALAQAQLVAEITGQAPIILLDDLEAELATEWQQRLLKALLQYPGQSLVTSLEWRDSLLPSGTSANEYTVFHVEHGHVVPSMPGTLKE
ncbi:MAG: DNA replication and repair protein RecF [Stagnimonas sp.]|nr:DNA replication and repair protein RecF [Stagnimonas sp.]